MDSITYENTQTIRQLLENAILECGKDVYIRYEENNKIVSVTYNEFSNLSRKVGAFISDKRTQFKRQIHVGIIGNASLNYITLLFGVMGTGNVVVPLDNQLDATNLSTNLNRSDVDILFYDPEYQELIESVKSQCPNVTEYYLLGKKEEGKPCLNDIYENPRYTGNEWAVSEVEDTVPTPDDLALILFTSGTTGHSKGVMLTHLNLVGNAISQIPEDKEGFIVKATTIMVLPIHHVYCLSTDVLAIMCRGATVCINGPISKLVDHLQLFQPTEIHMVPMIAKVLYNKIKSIVADFPGFTEKDVLPMIYGNRIYQIVCGGGGLSGDLAQKYSDMGVKIAQGYGMSECSAVVSTTEINRVDKLDSSGRLIPHFEIRIGENGEIQLKSPFIMKGYYKDPELTKEAYTEDGWFRTGDIGYVDEENFIYLTGRIKNLIILSNGENVAPEEIERKFDTDNIISDIIVFQEDDIIKCEVYPNVAYAKSIGIEPQNIETEIKKIVSMHNSELPSFKRIMKTSIRSKPFKKTTSNKIIRKAFLEERKAIKEFSENVKLPENETQQKIYDVCAECLGHKKFGIDTDLYSVGLDSFASVMLLSTLFNKYKLSLTLSELMDNSSVEKIVSYWEEKQKKSTVDYTPREKYPLTENQIHMTNTMTNNSTATLPYLFKLSDKIDMKRMEEAIIKLFDLHPILFAKVEPEDDGKLYLHRKPVGPVNIEKMKLTCAEWEEKKKTLIVTWLYAEKPGDDLYRVGLYETTDDGAKYIFLELSHLIGDGTSMKNLFDDISRLYLGENIEKQEYSFYEYVLDELECEKNGSYKNDTETYKKTLEEYELTRAVLCRKDCYDLDKSVNSTIIGRFNKLDQKEVQNFCAKYNITENSIFLTAFSYTLSVFSGLDDVAITSIYNGRTNGKWARILGQLFIWYPFRYKNVPGEKVIDLLKSNTGKILNTMKTHMSIRPDEFLVQYQGDLLNIPKVGGEDAEMVDLDMDSTPFHLMMFSDNMGYPYQLWYGGNRYDGELLKIFFAAMEDVAYAMLHETSVSKLKDYISPHLIPKHLTVSGKALNEFVEREVVSVENEDMKVKPYVLDDFGKKKPYGGWGKLYVLNQPVNGNGEQIESSYTPGTLYNTGIIARIMPNGSIETLPQAGRLVARETLYGRYYVDLYKLEQTLKEYEGVENAECSLVYGDNNYFRIKAHISGLSQPNDEAIKKYVEDKLGKDMVPEIISY